MNQTLENGKKTNFGPNFGLFWPKFTSTTCYALLQTTKN